MQFTVKSSLARCLVSCNPRTHVSFVSRVHCQCLACDCVCVTFRRCMRVCGGTRYVARKERREREREAKTRRRDRTALSGLCAGSATVLVSSCLVCSSPGPPF
ncbi:unnamed protein product, partial [Ectocarpus sp. 12 AP-2014]